MHDTRFESIIKKAVCSDNLIKGDNGLTVTLGIHLKAVESGKSNNVDQFMMT